jgi:hypothetical protein
MPKGVGHRLSNEQQRKVCMKRDTNGCKTVPSCLQEHCLPCMSWCRLKGTVVVSDISQRSNKTCIQQQSHDAQSSEAAVASDTLVNSVLGLRTMWHFQYVSARE